MNFTTPMLSILSFLGLLKQNREVIIPSDSKAYHELSKAGIKASKINKKDRTQSFFEKYFQEKVIILPKQEGKDKLQAKLRNINLKNKTLQLSKEKKKWIKRLEKAIVNNKVEFYFDNHSKSDYITGIWNKFLYLPRPKNQHTKSDRKFPAYKQEKLMQELKNTPIFVVENIFNEIISGESKNSFYKNFVEKLEAKYYNMFFWQPENELKEPYRMAFAFTNPQDAIELKEYLTEQFPYSTYEVDLSVKTMSLAEFYKLSKTAGSMNQLRIVPDVKDLCNLLLKSRKKGHIKFHKRQVYGKDFFQGQPIYKLIAAKTNLKPNKEYIHNIGNETVYLNYTPQHELIFLNDITYYFTNLEDAEKAWASFSLRYNRIGVPKKPKIEVYNLESLLSDYEQDIEGIPNKIRIIPTNEAKVFIRTEYNTEKSPVFSFKNYKLVWRIKIGIDRFAWGLTHRTSPFEYPAKWW
uniref:Uncharacterized protein n=1 Tax=Porphyridium purpureum TaxID=35688 RepID=A0A343KNW5_PORPP|nr:hypothetical protein [Porphyridium purpureum]